MILPPNQNFKTLRLIGIGICERTSMWISIDSGQIEFENLSYSKSIALLLLDFIIILIIIINVIIIISITVIIYYYYYYCYYCNY